MNTIGPVMLDLAGTQVSKEEEKCLANPLVGGVIIFSRNIESADQLCSLNASIRNINPNLVIAIDQEGGRVQRINTQVTPLPALGSLETLYQERPSEAKVAAQCHGALMASEMLSLGFDISFSPVLDIETGISQVIGNRAFGSTPDHVITLAQAYITGMTTVGMSAVGKHFPGHGSVSADSHHEVPIDERTWESIEQWDLQPFKSLAHSLDGMMPAHVIYPKVCPQPAGFSTKWLQDILRQQLGFDGVIFSDDLSMEGATVVGGFEERARFALQAGCDMILVCNQPKAAQRVIDFLEQNQSADWLKKAISDAQPRLQKLLSHDTLKWSEYKASQDRKHLQKGIAHLT